MKYSSFSASLGITMLNKIDTRILPYHAAVMRINWHATRVHSTDLEQVCPVVVMPCLRFRGTQAVGAAVGEPAPITNYICHESRRHLKYTGAKVGAPESIDTYAHMQT